MTERNGNGQAQVMSFLAQVAKESAERPSHDVSRLLSDLGYAGNDDDSEFGFGNSSSMGSFAFDSADSANGALFASKDERRALANFIPAITCNSVLRATEEDDGSAPTPGAGHITLVPWRGDCAVLFVDLSGYSKITSALISKGAHALSDAVNGYFAEILSIVVGQFRGDVQKFAGDAIVVLFPTIGDDARRACLTACACALELQGRVAVHQVKGTDLFFRLHCAVTFGVIESEIFLAPSAVTMQRGFHFLSGAPLSEIGPVVDAAGSGEICADGAVLSLTGDLVHTQPLSAARVAALPRGKNPNGIRLVVGIDDDCASAFDVTEAEGDLTYAPHPKMESFLIPPPIARRLRQGFKPNHLAEMRQLCVLFIYKTETSINTGDWFLEVFGILDRNRCPIVQVIEDDKGVHVIAAVNLYVAETEPSATGIKVLHELLRRKAGCVTGMDCGDVFCGVTGSGDARRWDIAGPAAVNAARLMQWAIAHNETEAMGQGIHATTSDISTIECANPAVQMKGWPAPAPVYRLSRANRLNASSGISSSFFPCQAIHVDAFAMAKAVADDTGTRHAISILWGPAGVGKSTVALSAGAHAGFVTMRHVLCRDRTPLAVADTLTSWFACHADSNVRSLADAARKAWDQGHATHALSLLLALVRATVDLGLQTCLVVTNGQFLDTLSASLFHELLCVQKVRNTQSGSPPTSPTLGEEARGATVGMAAASPSGRFIVFVCGSGMKGAHTLPQLRTMIDRYKPLCTIPTATLSPLGEDDWPAMMELIGTTQFWRVGERYARTILTITQGIPALVFPVVTELRKYALRHGSLTGRPDDRPLRGMTPNPPSQPRSEAGASPSGGRSLDISGDPSDLARYAAGGGDDVDVKKVIEEAQAKGVPPMTSAVELGSVEMTRRGLWELRTWRWSDMAPDQLVKLQSFYDVLPPRHQVLLRVLAAVANPSDQLAMSPIAHHVLTKLVPKATREQTEQDLRRVAELDLVRVDGRVVRFANPCLYEVVRALLTPEQARLMKRHAARFLSEKLEEWDERKRQVVVVVGTAPSSPVPPGSPVAGARPARGEGQRPSVVSSSDSVKAKRAAEAPTCAMGDARPPRSGVELHLHLATLWRGAGDAERQLKSLILARDTLLDETLDGIWDRSAEAGYQIAFIQELDLLQMPYEQFWDADWYAKMAARNPEGLQLLSMERLPRSPLHTPGFQWLKDYWPPVPLGAIAGEIQKMAWGIVLAATDKWTPQLQFVPPEMRPGARVDVGKVIAALTKLDDAIEGFTHPVSVKEETVILQSFLAAPFDAADLARKAAAFKQYHHQCIVPRARALVSFVGPLVLCIRPAKNTTFAAAVLRAWGRLVPTVVDDRGKGDPSSVPPINFHAALMDLATAGWKVPYMFTTLESVRDASLRGNAGRSSRTASMPEALDDASPLDLKAMLFCLLLCGSNLNPDDAPVQLMYGAGV